MLILPVGFKNELNAVRAIGLRDVGRVSLIRNIDPKAIASMAVSSPVADEPKIPKMAELPVFYMRGLS